MVDISGLADKIVAHVMKLGATDCDVMAADARYMSAEIEKGSIKTASTLIDPGVAVRAFVNGSAGFSSRTGLGMPAAKKAAELAVSQAKAGTPDAQFKGLPGKSKPRSAHGLFEKRLSSIDVEEIVSMAIGIAEEAGDDKRIVGVNASVNVGVGSYALANGEGFSGLQRLSSFEVGAEAVARSGTKMFSGMDGWWSRRLERAVIGRVGVSAREHALLGLKQARIPTGDYPVVLDPLAAGFILSAAIGGGVDAEGVQRKRSYLSEKLGLQVGSEEFTVFDDATLEWGPGSYSFDGEGVPASRKAIIEKGMLRSYLYDSYTAGKDGVKSTGNASRGSSMWSFRRTPTISSSNLVVKHGRSTFDEMISETKKGVYLRITFDTPNLATGEFSGLMMESFRIDKGELGPCIQQSTIGIGLIDMFSRIDMIGKDVREAFGVRTPALRISHARIAGSA